MNIDGTVHAKCPRCSEVMTVPMLIQNLEPSYMLDGRIIRISVTATGTFGHMCAEEATP